MKQNHTAKRNLRLLALLLVVLLGADVLLMPAQAADVSRKDILGWFSDNTAPRYSNTKFFLTADEMALYIANVFSYNGYDCGVLYDDSKSTKTDKFYQLMFKDVTGKKDAILSAGLSMSVESRTGDVYTVTTAILPGNWKDSQIAEAVDILTLVYEGLNRNMTDGKRSAMVTEGNLYQSGSSQVVWGILDGLYYEYAFSADKISLQMAPEGLVKLPAVAEYYTPGVWVEEPGFVITTGEVTRDTRGGISLEMTLQNKSKNPLLFRLVDAQADGEYDVPLSVYAEVAPGNSKTTTLHIKGGVLAATGLEKLESLRLTFDVEDRKTGASVYNCANWVPLGISVEGKMQENRKTLFSNKDFKLSIVGTSMDSGNVPELIFSLENSLYGYVRLQNNGDCVIGKEQYDLILSGKASHYSTLITSAMVLKDSWDGGAALKFELELCTANLNPLVAGMVTVKLDANGNIRSVTSKMKELSTYKTYIKEVQPG